MKLIFFCSLRARQSEVYITAKALAGSNSSPAVAPPGGRQCHKSIWRDGLRSFAHMSHAWSVNDNAKGHFLVVAACRQYQQEKERDRERVGEIDRESRKATLLPHFRLREHEGLQSNRPHITWKLRQLFCTSLSAWPAQRDLRPSEMSGHF